MCYRRASSESDTSVSWRIDSAPIASHFASNCWRAIARRPPHPRKLPLTGTAPTAEPPWRSSRDSPLYNSHGALTSIPPDATIASGPSTCSPHADALVCLGPVENLSTRSKAPCSSCSSDQIGRFDLPHPNFRRGSAGQSRFSRHKSAIQFP